MFFRSLLAFRLFFILLMLGCFAVGCGSSEVRGRIAGKVTFQGEAVPEGLVIFDNDACGVHMTAQIKPDGTYQVITSKGAGLPLGTYKVRVCPPRPVIVTGVPVQPKPKPYPNIPAKYRDPKTSGLTLNVQEEENQYDIAMQ